MKKISIITSTFNVESTFSRLIESVRASKTDQIQWIVVDGASQDSTVDIARGAMDVIDVFITEPDTGIYQAWNKALSYAEGEYLAFIGADDYISGQYFNEAIKAIDDHYNIIGFKVEMFSHDRSIYLNTTPWIQPRRFPVDLGIHHQGTLHAKSLFINQKYNEKYKIFGDQEFLIRNWRNIKIKVHVTEMPLIYFQIGGLSSSRDKLAMIYDDKLNLLKSIEYNNRFYIQKEILILYLKRAYLAMGLRKPCDWFARK